MKNEKCNCHSVNKVHAKAVSNAQTILKKLAPKPKPGERFEESLFFDDGRYIVHLQILADPQPVTMDPLPHSVISLFGVIDTFGVFVVEAKTLTPEPVNPKDIFEAQLKFSLAIGDGQTIDPLGLGVLVFDGATSKIRVKGVKGNVPSPMFKKKLDWQGFVDCVKDACPWPCFFSSWLCGGCIIACAYSNIYDN